MSGEFELLRAEIASLRSQRHKILFVLCKELSQIYSFLRSLKNDNIPSINVSLYLSEQLRNVSLNKRPFELTKHLRHIINEQNRDVVFLYNIEYLFNIELKKDPIKLLEALSGNTSLLVLWPGKIEQEALQYATPEHPEYYRNEEYTTRVFVY